MRSAFLIVFFSLSSAITSQKNPNNSSVDYLKHFYEFYQLLDENYIDTLNHEKLMDHVLKTTASSLDQYSQYFNQEESILRNKSWSGISYAGIGASINYIKKNAIIEHCKKGYGADSAGLMSGDVIVEINDSAIKNTNLNNTINLLKGEAGTVVKIKVKRGNRIKVFKIKRRHIINPSITYSKIEDHGFGVVKINQFLKGSGIEFRNEIIDLIEKGAQGFVLDLRGNKGGIVKECVSMLSVFLSKNTLVCELKSKDPKSNYKKYTLNEPISTKCPIVILIDSKTMSSAEIFAGAMQDLDRAVLIGDTTFGKGLVQGTRYLQDRSSLYVTAAKYYLPSGRTIHKRLNSKKFIFSSIPHEKEIFFTLNQRLVRGNNGLSPDIYVSPSTTPNEIVSAVYKSRLEFDYVVSMLRNQEISESKNPETDKKAYSNFLIKNINQINLVFEKQWSQIKEAKLQFNPSRSVNKKIEKEILNTKKKLIKAYIDDLYYQMNKTLIYHSKYHDGLYEFKLKKDDCFGEAIKVLSDMEKYKMILNH